MNLFKKIFFSVYKPFVAKRIYRSSMYRWNDIRLFIPAGVFHPAYFFSTRFLLESVLSHDLQNKKVLELGAGSGLISIVAAKKNAIVTSSDVSHRVIETLIENARTNGVDLNIIESDLFSAIPEQAFDIIAINPPYYPRNPRNDLEKAWYCGADHEYFRELFKSINDYMHNTTDALMVLSEDCNLDTISAIARENQFKIMLVEMRRFWWEWNMVYKLERRERSKTAY